jgi:hypothetical protein
MIQVNRIYLIFNRLVTKKFLVDTSAFIYKLILFYYEKLFNDTAHDCFDYIMLFKGR